MSNPGPISLNLFVTQLQLYQSPKMLIDPLTSYSVLSPVFRIKLMYAMNELYEQHVS